MNKIADTSLISAERSSLIQLHGKKVYVAGPMTGLPEFNSPAFFAAEEYLIGHGAKVMNPAVLPKGFEHHEYMSIAIPMMLSCEAVAFLPGWQQSKGARMEFTKAHHGQKILLALDVDHVAGKPWVKTHGPLMRGE